MTVRYTRKKDGKVLTYSQPIPRLEKSKDFTRVDDTPAPKADAAKPAAKKSAAAKPRKRKS